MADNEQVKSVEQTASDDASDSGFNPINLAEAFGEMAQETEVQQQVGSIVLKGNLLYESLKKKVRNLTENTEKEPSDLKQQVKPGEDAESDEQIELLRKMSEDPDVQKEVGTGVLLAVGVLAVTFCALNMVCDNFQKKHDDLMNRLAEEGNESADEETEPENV